MKRNSTVAGTRKCFWTAALAALVLAVPGGLCRAQGIVTSALLGGTLHVLGDGEANSFILWGDPDTDTLRITGPRADDYTFPPIAAYPLHEIRRVLVDTGSGDDTVAVFGSFPADVRIATGAGRDDIQVSGILASTIAGVLTIETGKDEDAVLIGALSVRDALEIRTGEGDDSLHFHTRSTIDIGSDLLVDTGAGDDWTAFLVSVDVHGDLDVNLGQGDDAVYFAETLPTPRVVVDGAASLNASHGYDTMSGGFPPDDLIVSGNGVEFAGFEVVPLEP